MTWTENGCKKKDCFMIENMKYKSGKKYVNDKTTLTGASITNVDKNGNDQANLKLSTKTLESQNIQDSDTYDSTTMG